MNTKSEVITIDGNTGEGGGQMLRSALTLSMITRKPLKMINIRKKRTKPGLLRQHVTALKAAQAICNAMQMVDKTCVQTTWISTTVQEGGESAKLI